MYLKYFGYLFFFMPVALAAQYPYTSNDYIRQNTNIITGNDLLYPGGFDNFKGKIKSITQQEYAAMKDTAGGVQRREFLDSQTSFTYFFDKDKKIKESWKYASNQTIISKKNFRSFKNDQLDSAKTWSKSGKLMSSEKWEYNEKNQPVVKRISMLKETRDLPVALSNEGDKTILFLGDYRNVYQHNQLIARTNIPSKKEINYTYHQNGLLKTKKETEQDRITKIYEYDEKENLIRYTFYTYAKEGGLVATTDESITYDPEGRKASSIIAINTEDSSGIKTQEMYEYEGKNLSRIYRIEKGEKKIFATYRYNKQLDLIAIETEKVKFTTDYSGYDKQGNWTRAVIFRDGEPFYIRERTIQYY